jgi:nucleoside 2-deoxyribosyltransferase
VLSIEVVTTQAREHDPQHADPALKARLDELHKRKIDLADYVLVLNVGGYIGRSTRSEIAYAAAHGKPVIYLTTGAADDGLTAELFDAAPYRRNPR